LTQKLCYDLCANVSGTGKHHTNHLVRNVQFLLGVVLRGYAAWIAERPPAIRGQYETIRTAQADQQAHRIAPP
jgi:hypothetical protein